MPTIDELRILQALPLDIKIQKTQIRIQEFIDRFGEDGVYIAFSGGKDSTVLLDICRKMYPDMVAVFCDTGLELPPIRKFALSKDNVKVARPKYSFKDVIRTYGYPIASKEVSETIYYARSICDRDEMSTRRKKILGAIEDNGDKKSMFNYSFWLPLCRLPIPISSYCCDVMKKNPSKSYSTKTGRHPILATTTDESMLRQNRWLKYGCNIFSGDTISSTPMAFWKEQDVLQYIKDNDLEIASVYGDVINETVVDRKGNESCRLCTTGYRRTGCVFCAYGAHLEKQGDRRFVKLKKEYPALYEYCMGGGEWIDNPKYVEGCPKYGKDGWENWNPKKIWVPSDEGLGMRNVFEMINNVYGAEFISCE